MAASDDRDNDDIVGRVQVEEVDEESVLAERNGGVTLVTLNRPHRRNATTFSMLNRYFDLLDEADADPDVKVVVVTGAGSSFCVGMDTESLTQSSTQGLMRRPDKNREMNHANTLRKPLIAAINGACAGLGLIQALDCDIRFAAETAVFATAFVRRGLNAEYGSSWKLPRIVGHGRASELLLLGRKFDAAEAERIGLVSRLYPHDRLLEETMLYAADIAQNCSPTAMADVKLQIDTDWHLPRTQAQNQAKIMSHEPGHRVDFAEGVMSYKEKRPPRFAPLPDKQTS